MEANPKKPNGEIIVHVMPKEFLGREATLVEKCKMPTAPSAPMPIVPKPPGPPIFSPKKKSRLPFILLVVGVIFIISLSDFINPAKVINISFFEVNMGTTIVFIKKIRDRHPFRVKIGLSVITITSK